MKQMEAKVVRETKGTGLVLNEQIREVWVGRPGQGGEGLEG